MKRASSRRRASLFGAASTGGPLVGTYHNVAGVVLERAAVLGLGPPRPRIAEDRDQIVYAWAALASPEPGHGRGLIEKEVAAGTRRGGAAQLGPGAKGKGRRGGPDDGRAKSLLSFVDRVKHGGYRIVPGGYREAAGRQSGPRVAELEARVATLSQQRASAEERAQGLQRELGQKSASLAASSSAMRAKEDEVETLNMTLAELKTEVTIARAELDGAYGSRAERAAEVAAIKTSAEVVKLQNQVDRLKKELGATVQELEAMTKETIGSEREKVELEAKLDEALSARAALEAEAHKSRERLAKLHEDLDGERLRAAASAGGGGRPGAGASMLSEQFRATMREERKKFQEDLKVRSARAEGGRRGADDGSQEERARCRKLEEELGRLKRSQGPGKSPLSPRQ